MNQNSIEPFMHQSILVLNKKTSARVAARALFERNVGCAVVCDEDRHIVGLLTDRDLTCLVLAFELPDTTPIQNIMATEIQTVDTNATLDDVIDIMEQNGVRRVPIIQTLKNEHERCVGMVTLDDLIVLNLIDRVRLSKIVGSQVTPHVRDNYFSIQTEFAQDHVYGRFIEKLMETTSLPQQCCEKISTHLLERIVQRLPSMEAINFVSHLPVAIQESLLKFTTGPDILIDGNVMMSDMTQQFQLLHQEAIMITKKFWQGLQQYLDPYILKSVIDHLPQSMTELLTGQDWFERSTLAEF